MRGIGGGVPSQSERGGGRAAGTNGEERVLLDSRRWPVRVESCREGGGGRGLRGRVRVRLGQIRVRVRMRKTVRVRVRVGGWVLGRVAVREGHARGRLRGVRERRARRVRVGRLQRWGRHRGRGRGRERGDAGVGIGWVRRLDGLLLYRAARLEFGVVAASLRRAGQGREIADAQVRTKSGAKRGRATRARAISLLNGRAAVGASQRSLPIST